MSTIYHRQLHAMEYEGLPKWKLLTNITMC